ncbi:PaaX family transcriptional regulator C-terminal domain-containing protein [Acidiferrimicrobium sp. IK]|uniref:PaaX family transcriptional regulator n=1 Tax=Acidiferrimicrobium sp. IK TaxID=2871700 RepID=UPI003966B932
MLLTVLGEFVLPAGGAAWTATLVQSMAAIGIAEKNARQAIARLADQGLIVSHRAGRRVRWQLSDDGRALLTQGAARIYGFLTERATWDGRWLVVTFSVPEEQRARRHLLRQQLGFAGFGFPGAGVAVSTHLDREAVAVAALRNLGIDDGAMVFRGEAGALAGDAELVRRAWDLDDLGRSYEQFLQRFGGLRPDGEREALAALTHLVHEWRRFPFVDPELPADLLPAGWPGQRARQLFDGCHSEWVAPARAWFAAADRVD